MHCVHDNDRLCCLIIFSGSDQIMIHLSSCKVAGSNHEPIYILMSLTFEGSIKYIVLNDANQREVLSPITGGGKPADYDLW